MSSAAGIQAEIASVITGILLLFSACGAYMKYKIKTLEYDIASEQKNTVQKQGEEVEKNEYSNYRWFIFYIAAFIMAIGGIYSEKSGITNLALEGFARFWCFL